MAKFSFSIDTDNLAEAQKIAEAMQDIAFTMKTGKKTLAVYQANKSRDKAQEFTIVDRRQDVDFTGTASDRASVKEGAGLLLDWIKKALDATHLRNLVEDNVDFVRMHCNRGLQARMGAAVEKREGELEELQGKKAPPTAPEEPPTMERILQQFRVLYDMEGGEAACGEVLKLLNVEKIVALPNVKYGAAVKAIGQHIEKLRSNGVAQGTLSPAT